MHFHIITLFPEIFDSYINGSIIGRAVKDKKIKINFYNPRDFTKDKHRRVDQKPYGGGPGMVMEPISTIKAIKKAIGAKKDVKVIIFEADGKDFTNTYAKNCIKKYKHIVLIAGHYEGIDARVKKIFKAESISIGPYILTGGELPALVAIDAMARQVKGVLGNEDSIEENRVSTSEVYTRPEEFIFEGKKYKVPKVLLSGHHKNINEWKGKRKK
jgi:tRNA (guanine37-N1)-methyltransferase